jgi:hypothetical protein
MLKVLGSLRSICPALQHIKLDKKRAEEFPDLLQVLKSHSQSCDYMIQFFKEPLIENRKCKACNDRLIKHVRMLRELYNKVMDCHMPMPIPKPIVAGDKEIEYMSFADAHTRPFTNEHQPSLAVTALRAATRKKKASIREQLPSSRRRVFPFAMNITKLKNKSDFKIGVATKVRGVVECNNCKRVSLHLVILGLVSHKASSTPAH